MVRSAFKKSVREYNFHNAKQKTNKLLSAKLNNAKEYWKLLKEASGIKNESKIHADSFLQYFKAINNPSNPFFQADEDVIYFTERFLDSEVKIMFDESNVSITPGEVDKSISQLKSAKSGGPDLAINEFIMHGRHILNQTLCDLF